jgi:hypothetical protein
MSRLFDASLSSFFAESESRDVAARVHAVMNRQLDLALHHVGGRGGSRRFPVLPFFEKDVLNVLYDGDPDCTEQMIGATSNLESRTIALSSCVGGAPGPSQLRIYRNSGASSLLPFEEQYRRRFLALGWDSTDLLSSSYDIQQSIPVQLETLDGILSRTGDAIPPPDFLSLNTQGTELEIMYGAREALRTKVISLQAEVSLFEIYAGQADLTQLVREAERGGFLLSHIFQLGAWVPSFSVQGRSIRPPVGLRSGGVALQADVEFFKDPNHILLYHANAQLDLVKATFLAVALMNYSLSFCYSSLIDRRYLLELAAEAQGRRGYIDFVLAYSLALDKQPRILPIDVIYTEHASGGTAAAPQALRVEYFREIDRSAFAAHAPGLLSDDWTELEAVCLRFGLPKSANLLKQCRLNGMRTICEALGLLKPGGTMLDHHAMEQL